MPRIHDAKCAHPAPAGVGRRRFLSSLSAGIGMLAAARGAEAQQVRSEDLSPDQIARLSRAELDAVPALRPASQAAIALTRRIDVHHHPVPPAYEQAVTPRTGLAGPLRGWSPEKSLADMDRAGVATAILSIPANGLWLPDAEANRRLARSCNEYMAGLVARYPGRFGFWAALPLPDIDGSLQEMDYALHALHADGVELFTNYGDKWLGDASFAPLFAEMNRRGVVAFTHPKSAACCGALIPGVPPSIVEYATDTARAIANLLFSGAALRFPDVKLIFSHAGGTMPTLIERFVLLSRQPTMAQATPDGVLPLLRRFYFDVAQAANLETLGPLTRLVPTSQVLFGTDFPYRASIEQVAGLVGCGFSNAQLIAIGRGNALNLLPRLG